VRGLNLKDVTQWKTYSKSAKKPIDIPSHPDRTYADAGWVRWSDWLGTRRRRGGWRSFKDARAFMHSLRLKNVEEWRTYYRSGKKPDDVPTDPNRVYADAGWVDWSDWLGTAQRQQMGPLRTVIRSPNLAVPRRRRAAHMD